MNFLGTIVICVDLRAPRCYFSLPEEVPVKLTFNQIHPKIYCYAYMPMGSIILTSWVSNVVNMPLLGEVNYPELQDFVGQSRPSLS